MKTKFILFLLFVASCSGHSQYIGVKARYTETRLADNSPEPPSRENRLVLSFYTVNASGVYSATSLSNYDLYIYKEGFQYGSYMGGVVDSNGNNYEGYPWTAPKAVAYYNSLGLNYIDCNPSITSHYVVNGHELDCGFIRVSSWEAGNETFYAPNICLPYYIFPDPYSMSPGNVNFSWPVFPTAPYNMYNFSCGGNLQVVIRGVLGADTGIANITLPVRFANVSGEMEENGKAKISWTNLTESSIIAYTIERSLTGSSWIPAGTVAPVRNDGSRADYNFQTLQPEETCYYRIRATEINGTNFYSSIFVLRKLTLSSIPQETAQVLSVYPNPVTGNEFTLRLTNAMKGRYLSMIVTPDGKQIKQKMIEHERSGDLIRQINLEGLLPGAYQFVLRSSLYKYSQPLIVSQ